MQNIKKIIDNASFFTFSTTLDLIWPKFYPKTTPNFFCFPMKYVRDSIYINKFNWNQ